METITYAIEPVLSVADELLPLLQLHHEEVEFDKDVMPLDPDWARYVASEEMGACRVFTMRDDKVLVGYAAFFIGPHLHHQGQTVAVNDSIFLHMSYRRGLAALRFIQFCEKKLKELGAVKVTLSVKKNKDWSPVLIRTGYEVEEIVLGKVL